MNNINRLAAIAAAAMLLALIAPSSSTAADTPVAVSIPDCGALPGETTSVAIVIHNVSNIMTGEINLTYDASVVHVTSVQDSDFDMLTVNMQNASGYTRIGGWQFSSPPMNGTITLATVTLKATGDEGDRSPLAFAKIELINESDVILPDEPVNGTFTIPDGTAPRITDGSPATATAGETYTFAATVTDNDAVADVTVEYWNMTGHHVNRSMDKNGNSYQYTVDVPPATEQLHYIIAASDASGNWNSTSGDVTVTDDMPPSISDISANPVSQQPGGTVNITCTASDNVQVQDVTVNITHPDSSTEIVAMSRVPDTPTYYHEAAYTTTGEHRFHIWASDGSNSATSTVHTFEIIPQHTLHTTVMPAGAGTIDLQPDGGTYPEDTTVTVTASPSQGYTFHQWSGDASGGSTTMQVTMTRDISLTAHFTEAPSPPPENQPPSVSLDTPADGATVTGNVTIEGTASDSDGSVTSVDISIDGGGWQTATGTSDWSYTWNTSSVANGDHVIRARSYDGENYSDVAAVPVEVSNNHPPAVTITTPPPGTTVNEAVLVRGNASDPDGNTSITKVEVKIGNQSWTTADGIENWACPLEPETLSEGACTIQARAYDGTSYSDITSITVTIDTAGESSSGVGMLLPILAIVAAIAAAIIILLLRRGT